MPRYAPNKMPAAVKRRYFELIRSGLSGSEASQRVGVSLSCGSLWFIDAGRVSFIESAISPRYLSQDDRIEIAGGMARGEPVKAIAARIGQLTQCLDLISYKVRVYEDHLAQSTASQLWSASSVPENE
jgi:IS30 family transposase